MSTAQAPTAVKDRCRAITSSGKRCRNHAIDDRGFCRIHAAPTTITRANQLERRSPEAMLDERIRKVIGFMRRRLLGEYQIDQFGFDRELTEEILHPIAMFMYQRFWRVTTIGIENIPSRGPALLISNHSGTLPWDAVMMKFGILEDHPEHRHARLLAADLAISVPFISHLARKSGNTVAIQDDAIRLLTSGELVGVFPEGFKGVGKNYRDRYRLQRFGRGGFIEVALKTQVPVIPVAIVGAEEIYPMVGDIKPLARLLGFPYFPVTPAFPLLGPLGALPLPTKWMIEFGAPITMDQYGSKAFEDTMLVFDLTDQIRDTIQQMLNRNLAARKGLFR